VITTDIFELHVSYESLSIETAEGSREIAPSILPGAILKGELENE